MTRRHGRQIVISTLLAGVAAIVVILLNHESPGVTQASLKRLRPKMTEEEVERLLGPPSADLTGQARLGGSVPVGPGRFLQYDGDGQMVKIEFDQEGCIVQVFAYVTRLSTLDRLRLRLGWR